MLVRIQSPRPAIMTNAEFLDNSPAVVGLLQILGRDLDWHASFGLGTDAFTLTNMRTLVQRGLVKHTTVVPDNGMKVVTYYKITADGWLLLHGRYSELDNA